MIRNIVKYTYQFVLNRLPDYAAVNLMYFRRFHKLPNLKKPKTFNEKIAWRKLYQRNPQFALFADKIAVKKEVAKLVGEQHIINTLWIGENPNDIPFNDLIPPCVIKVNHSSGGNIFIRAKQDIDESKIISSLEKQLNFSHGHVFREWGYLDIPRKIIIEHMIELPGGDVPEDYKFFVYHGRAHFIQVDQGRFKGHTRNLYDRDWNHLPVKFQYPSTSTLLPRPSNLEQMIDIAEKIGAQFDFVRVDLYSSPNGILFGEATFYPEAGVGAFTPNEWDRTFGNPWRIS